MERLQFIEFRRVPNRLHETEACIASFKTAKRKEEKIKKEV
jgi:hypothetical protein